MTPVAEVLQEVARLGIELQAIGGSLRFHPRAKMTTQLADLLRARKAAIIEFLTADTADADENTKNPEKNTNCVGVGAVGTPKTKPERLACNARCKRCERRIAWGEVIKIQDSAHPAGRKPTTRDRKWIPLDADYMPHGCGRKVRCENKDSIFEEAVE